MLSFQVEAIKHSKAGCDAAFLHALQLATKISKTVRIDKDTIKLKVSTYSSTQPKPERDAKHRETNESTEEVTAKQHAKRGRF